MASPDPLVEERNMYLSMLGWTVDDPSYSLAELRDMTAGGANVKRAVEAGALVGKGIPFLKIVDAEALYQKKHTNKPINVADEYGRTDANVRAAVAAALVSNRALYFPGGADYTVNGNIVVTAKIEIIGDGFLSRILFTDGGFVFDATAGYILHSKIRDIRIRRIGTVAGPALHLKGAGVFGVARFNAYNVTLQSPAGTGGSTNAGDCLLLEGSFIGFFFGCYFEEGKYGIRGIVSSGLATGINATVFYGGEANGNETGWMFERPCGVAFYGFTTEGNYLRGGRIHGVARGFTYSGGYFELNTGPDIEVDCNAGAGAILLESNVFFCSGATKTESILLKRGRVGVNNNYFTGLVEGEGDVAIRISETTAPVSGEARNNMREDDGTLIAYTAGGVAFNITHVGQITKAGNTVSSSALNEQAGIGWMRKVSAALDFPSIPANSEATLTVSVPGAITSDDVSVSSSALEAGLVLKSWGVTAADTVSIILRNVTAAAIDPSARTYRVRVWR